MKKALLWICACVIALSALSICAFAKDVVIYENDFSDPATISDFKTYRLGWEIRDGGLYMNDTVDGDLGSASLLNSFAHIIWQAPQALPEEYVVEADVYNVQTSTGIVFNAEQDKVTNATGNSFYGYLAFIASDAKKGALGSTTHDGNWSGNIHVGTSNGSCVPGSNVHIRVEVSGDNIKVLITNIDTAATVYSYEYTKGAHSKDCLFDSDTVGFRMCAKEASIGKTYFDNFKITTPGSVYLSFNKDDATGRNPADSNDGLTAGTPVKTWAKAVELLGGEGGKIILLGKGYMGASNELTAQTAPVTITSTGTFTPGDADGNFMLEHKPDPAIFTIYSDLIFDNVGIVSRATVENIILVKSGVTLTITDTVVFSEKAGGTYIHYKLVLEEGATAYLSEAAQKWLTIENNGGNLYNYGKETGLYGNVTLAKATELVYNGKAQAALVLPEGVTVKKSDAKGIGTYTDHTVVLTADGYNDYTILVPETTITAVALTVSDVKTKKIGNDYTIDYKLTGVVDGDDVALAVQGYNWDGEDEILRVLVALDGTDKGNYTLATTIYVVDVSATASKCTVKYFKDGKEVSEDTLELNRPFPAKVEESDLEFLKKDYEGYELDSITDAEGNPIEAPFVTGENTVICYNYKTPGGEGGEGEENEQLKALKTVALVTTVRKNYVRNTTTTINFITRGGERLPSITVRGGAVELPTPANKPGYTFGGWYMDTNCVRPYTANTALSGSVTLYAKWVKN